MAGRLVLTPLRVADAVPMVAVLADPALYRWTGGDPPTVGELVERYRRQAAGRSPDGRDLWFTWIVRLRSTGEAVGYVQASVPDGGDTAQLAWVVGTAWQGRGYATEAARTVRELLAREGVTRVVAYVHPDHAASTAVARRLGLEPTGTVVDGEAEWAGEGLP